MIRKNFMNILLGLGAVGAILVAYNAFIAGNDGDNSASNRLGSYLAVDKTKQEAADSDTAVVGTDNSNSSSTESVESPAPASENTSQPSENSAPTEQTEEAGESVVSTPTPAGSDKAETVYTVKEGDTYGCIAEKYYGSYEHYVEIMAANPVYNLGFGEYSLFVDAQLVLPAISATNLKPASSLCS